MRRTRFRRDEENFFNLVSRLFVDLKFARRCSWQIFVGLRCSAVRLFDLSEWSSIARARVKESLEFAKENRRIAVFLFFRVRTEERSARRQ